MGLARIAACLVLALVLASCSDNTPSSSSALPPAVVKSQVVAADYTGVVQQLYVSYYGRPADPAGLNFWGGVLAAGNAPTDSSSFIAAYGTNASVKSVMDSFGTSAESTALYGAGNAAIVAAIYQNLFNRAAEPAGLAFWVNALDTGQMSAAQAAMIIASSAQGSDTQSIQNKVAVATRFTAGATTPQQIAAYSGLAAGAAIRQVLGTVASTSDVNAATTSILTALAAIAGIAAPVDVSGLRNMRAVHMGGYWGNNRKGIKTVVPGPLANGKSLAATMQVTSRRSSFVDGSGATQTTDGAVVRLTDVVIGGAPPLANAGFWLVRDVATGAIWLQFQPSVDVNLAGIAGFPRDMSLGLSPDGAALNTGDAVGLSGVALDLVAAVLSHAAELAATAAYSVEPPSALGKEAIVAALTTIALRANESAAKDYFAFLKAENVQWVGVSVAIFVDSVSDPMVRVHYGPDGDVSGRVFTFADADLKAFLLAARANGFKTYLTLAFESPQLARDPDPSCNTRDFPIPRYMFGYPYLDSASAVIACVNPAYWWWNPAHPDHAANLATFWDSYTQIAVRYGALAQETGVDMYSLGTETEGLFRTRAGGLWSNHFLAELTRMVGAVRTVYHGVLTYDQEYGALKFPDVFTSQHTLFADLGLDAIGISAYFPLTAQATRLFSLAELETLWSAVFTQYLVPLQQRNPGKPILFLEMGYTDDVRSPADPTAGAFQPVGTLNAAGETDGMIQQRNVLQAFFNTNDQFGQLVRGSFLWGNQIISPREALCPLVDTGVYCKSAAATVAAIYDALAKRDVAPASSP